MSDHRPNLYQAEEVALIGNHNNADNNLCWEYTKFIRCNSSEYPGSISLGNRKSHHFGICWTVTSRTSSRIMNKDLSVNTDFTGLSFPMWLKGS